MEPIAKRPVGRPRKTPKVDAPAKAKGDGLRRAANRAKEGASTVKSYAFPVKPPELASANDDQVDALTQALRRLYPLFNKLKISQAALDKAMGR